MFRAQSIAFEVDLSIQGWSCSVWGPWWGRELKVGLGQHTGRHIENSEHSVESADLLRSRVRRGHNEGVMW